MTLTVEKLKESVHYDPITGVFIRIKKTSNRIKIGDVAGSKDHYGYLRFNVQSKVYKAHRLAWLYMTGDWPKLEIDHINCNPADNRFDNLREANRTKNMQNQRHAKGFSKTGVLGASPQRGRYKAQIQVNGNKQHIGMYATPELAHSAYLAAKRQFHEGCTI